MKYEAVRIKNLLIEPEREQVVGTLQCGAIFVNVYGKRTLVAHRLGEVKQAWPNSNRDIFLRPQPHSARLWPQIPRARRLACCLGLGYYGAGKYHLAGQILQPAAKQDPDNAELHQVLAQSCLWAKKLACAQAEFRQMLEHNADSAEAHTLTGEALDALGRTEEAIKEFETAAKIAPPAAESPFRPRLSLLEDAALRSRQKSQGGVLAGEVFGGRRIRPVRGTSTLMPTVLKIVPGSKISRGAACELI